MVALKETIFFLLFAYIYSRKLVLPGTVIIFMRINYNRKLFSNFVSLSIVQGINFLIPLLITPYVITKVGITSIGTIALAQTVMIYLSTITDYSFNVSAVKDMTIYKEDSIRSSKIFFTVLASKLLITFLLFLLLLVLIFFIPVMRQHAMLYLLGFIFVIAQAFTVNWFFLGIEKMHFITIGSLVSRLIFVVLVFIFITGKEDDKLFLFFLGMGNLVAALFSVVVAIRLLKLQFFRPLWTDIMNELKTGWHVTLSVLSLNTYLLSGIFILRFFTNDTIVGYYSVASRVFFAARQVLAVFSEAVYPHVCQLVLKGKEAGRLFFKQVYLPLLAATVAGSVLLYLLSPQVIFFFTKEHVELPVFLLRLLSFVPVIVCLNIPAYQLLLAFDRKKSYLRVFGFATILNIGINILLVNIWGATGTVLGIIITEFFITAGLSRELHKNKLSGFIYQETT